MYNICINSLKTEYMNTVYFDHIHPILPLFFSDPPLTSLSQHQLHVL